MKEPKKNKFANSAKTILKTEKPTGIADFLETSEETTNGNESVNTESRTNGERKTVKTDSRKSVNTQNRKEPPAQTDEPRTEREEFKLTKTLAQRLKRYAYERDIKKVDVVTQALEDLFDREGY